MAHDLLRGRPAGRNFARGAETTRSSGLDDLFREHPVRNLGQLFGFGTALYSLGKTALEGSAYLHAESVREKEKHASNAMAEAITSIPFLIAGLLFRYAGK